MCSEAPRCSATIQQRANGYDGSPDPIENLNPETQNLIDGATAGFIIEVVLFGYDKPPRRRRSALDCIRQ